MAQELLSNDTDARYHNGDGAVKVIKAYVRRSRIDDVVHGPKKLGVKAMSVIPVEGIGALDDPQASGLSLNYVTHYSLVSKLEIVCREHDTENTVRTLTDYAWTGMKGDGVMFVSDIERAIKIRSGQVGEFALDCPSEDMMTL